MGELLDVVLWPLFALGAAVIIVPIVVVIAVIVLVFVLRRKKASEERKREEVKINPSVPENDLQGSEREEKPHGEE